VRQIRGDHGLNLNPANNETEKGSTTMKIKKQTMLGKVATALMLQAMLLVTVLAPLQTMAVDIQTLPDTVAATSGFTHAARVTFDDLNNTDNAATILQLYNIPTNTYIDRVAWVIDDGFTNSTISATNLLLCVGVGGSTNAFFTTNQVDASSTMVGAGLTLFTLSTNMAVPYKSTTSTNYLVATLSAASSVVDTYTVGKIRIFWRVVQPARYKF
jgi:hypothetical protein